jgi:stage V sporulation protein SpoVS
MSIQVLRVAGNTNINAVAEAVVEYVVANGIVHIDCIGIKASYLTVKALVQVTEILVNKGYRFNLKPYYVKVKIKDNNVQSVVKTAIRWTLIANEKSI